jgi:hypothetical protein
MAKDKWWVGAKKPSFALDMSSRAGFNARANFMPGHQGQP